MRVLGGALSDDESDVVVDGVETVEAVEDVRFLDTDAEASGGLFVMFEEEVDAAESDVLDADLDISVCLYDARAYAVARRNGCRSRIGPVETYGIDITICSGAVDDFRGDKVILDDERQRNRVEFEVIRRMGRYEER